MAMEEETNYDIPDCDSPSSIYAEEDMITLENVSENVTPTCVLPEVMSSSQPSKQTTTHADGRIENLLKDLQTREEQMMQLHQERHDEIIAVHGKLLSQLMTITDIMQKNNHELVTHNAFMGAIAQSLQNKSDTENWQPSASRHTPTQIDQRHFTNASQSQLVAEEHQIAHISPHPVHTTVPIEDKLCDGVHSYADNATHHTTKQKVHPVQTARDCPDEVLFDELQHNAAVDTFDSVHFLPSQLKGTPGHMRSRGLGKRFRKASYSRGRGRNVLTRTYSTAAGNMSPSFPTTTTNVPYTITYAENSQLMGEIADEKHGKKKSKKHHNVTLHLERPQTRSQLH
ncbi:uncharacterized protein LOC142497984 [Ascaphus truei]|uniref:uncharacterized protein LOC142497984 n=1 Tax=Ascaphus truei TaxID=8439 RepID=UPI003F592F2A